MGKYASWEELILACEQDMIALENDKEYCFSIYRKMKTRIDTCLQTQDYHSLLDLSVYFDEPDQFPQFHQSGETRRIQILLNFLNLELKHNVTPFVSNVTDYVSFMEQYMLTVFALRRLELALSDDAVSEAAGYLNSIPFSIYSALIIIENESFENYERLYWSLYQNIDFWSITDKIYLLERCHKKAPSDRILIELASLYLETNAPHNAYSCLSDILSPSEDITKLLNLLKEKIENE